MPATLQTISALLKEVYEGRVREQLNDQTLLLKRLTKTNKGVTSETGGKYVTFPLHVRRNQGVGSRHEMEPLPVPGQQGHVAARIGLKSMYQGIQLSGQSIAMADTDAKSFATVLDNEVEGAKNDYKKDLNRQLYGFGDGRIGTVRAVVTASATIPVDDGRQFQLDMVVDIITLPATVTYTDRVVTAVDLTAGANTITVSGGVVTTTVGMIVTRKGSGPDAVKGNREVTGLQAIISDTGTLYNVDPSTEPTWKSEVNSNAGTPRALSEGLMTQMADRVRTNGGKTTLILQSLGVRRAYANLLTQTRSTVNTQEFVGGFKGLGFATDNGDIPVVADTDAPLGKQFFINEDALKWYRDEEVHWLDRDGSMWKQVITSAGVFDAWFANLAEYHELGTERRNTHGLIKDIAEA